MPQSEVLWVPVCLTSHACCLHLMVVAHTGTPCRRGPFVLRCTFLWWAFPRCSEDSVVLLNTLCE
jgi:hypothetical protein